MIVGLQVKNTIDYSHYREAMSPLLATFEGGFRYDFNVSETLKNEEGRPINRVFAIFFGSKEKMEQFFSHPDYLHIKARYFESSVEAMTIISEYSR